MDASSVCQMCGQALSVSAPISRIDQSVYTATWEHVAAAHFKESRDIRAMSVADRKRLLLSWSDLPQKDYDTDHPLTGI